MRTCDGRYFPLQRHAGASPAELCKSFCPAAKTMVFSGSKIDTAVAQNGTRYADLDNAFAYRDKVSRQLHLQRQGRARARARRASLSDPTLRPGDIVATDDGLATYTRQATRPRNSRRSASSSSEWARRLAEVKVRPAPPSEKIEAGGQRRRQAGPQGPRPGAPVAQARLKLSHHLVGERQRRGQPRRFDPEQMRQTRQPMLRRAFDHEIGGGLARPGQLRADAGIVGLQ